MSQTNSYDCLVVVSHGIVSSKETINKRLAEIAMYQDTEVSIVCPWQIWYFLEETEFNCVDQCIPILKRNPEKVETSVAEIVDATLQICEEKNYTRVGIVAHPDEVEECLNLFLKGGIHAFLIEDSY